MSLNIDRCAILMTKTNWYFDISLQATRQEIDLLHNHEKVQFVYCLLQKLGVVFEILDLLIWSDGPGIIQEYFLLILLEIRTPHGGWLLCDFCGFYVFYVYDAHDVDDVDDKLDIEIK